MATHFADRLLAAIRARRAPVCIGLDPVLERLPAGLRAADPVTALRRFGEAVIDCVAPSVPAIKINSAFFERYRGAGVDTYFDLTAHATRAGLLVIGDCKRGDIGHSAAEYAAAQFGADGDPAPDAVTLHSYLGADGVEPFVNVARERGRGVFVLVRTSNPSAAAVQDVASGSGTLSVAEHIADLVNAWSAEFGQRGSGGYDLVGAVVAARDPAMAAALRARMPHTLFLVPGYGAQGATAADIAHCFRDGQGAIVNASRSVIFAHEQPRWQAEHGDDWRACIAAAARDFADDVARAVGA